MIAEDEPERPELEAQMEVTKEAIRAVVLRLLQEGRVHPQLLILAVTQIAGKLGASDRACERAGGRGAAG